MAKDACSAKSGCQPKKLSGRAKGGRMCGLADDGKIKKMAKKAKDAQYICGICGYAAAKARDLCKPMEL